VCVIQGREPETNYTLLSRNRRFTDLLRRHWCRHFNIAFIDDRWTAASRGYLLVEHKQRPPYSTVLLTFYHISRFGNLVPMHTKRVCHLDTCSNVQISADSGTQILECDALHHVNNALKQLRGTHHDSQRANAINICLIVDSRYQLFRKGNVVFGVLPIRCCWRAWCR
jgi:hypothetical protein